MSLLITFEASLSPEGSPVIINIFFQKETIIKYDQGNALIFLLYFFSRPILEVQQGEQF